MFVATATVQISNESKCMGKIHLNAAHVTVGMHGKIRKQLRREKS